MKIMMISVLKKIVLTSIFPQIFHFIPFISSSEKEKHIAIKFLRKQRDCVVCVMVSVFKTSLNFSNWFIFFKPF